MLNKVIRDKVDELCIDRVVELCPCGEFVNSVHVDIFHQLCPWTKFINEYLPHNTYELRLKLEEIHTTN